MTSAFISKIPIAIPMHKQNTAPEVVSPEAVYNVICQAASQDPVQVRSAMDGLKTVLQMHGTSDALHAIAAQRDLPLPVRQQAMIQCKNALKDSWRSKRFINDEQRAQIRSRSLLFLDEQDDMIAQCNEVMVARISRLDYPTNWPTLIPNLMSVITPAFQQLGSSPQLDERSILLLRRSLKVLDEVLKEFAAVKLPAGMKVMHSLVMELDSVLYEYYTALAGRLTAYLTPSSINDPRTMVELRIAHLLFKCLVKINIWAWAKGIQKNVTEYEAMIQQFFTASCLHLKSFSEARLAIASSLSSTPSKPPGARTALRQLSAHVRLFGKLYRRMHQLHPVQFSNMPASSDLATYYWEKVAAASSAAAVGIEDSDEAVYPVRFLVQGMVIFKDLLLQWNNRPKHGAQPSIVLNQQFVENAVNLLIERYLPLKEADLENWASDPEEWVTTEDRENDNWEYEVRACAERVLMTLSQHYKEYVTPQLSAKFGAMMTRIPTNLGEVVQKEALYCAIGRCAPRLKDDVPFDLWLEHVVSAEVAQTNSMFSILKRRIAWVIGKWVSDGCASPANKKVWYVLVHLLQDTSGGTEGVVVRLTAAHSIGEAVDATYTVEFDSAILQPYIASIVGELLRLLVDVETSDMKRRVLRSLNNVVMQAGTNIIVHASSITNMLPQLWLAADTDYLLKNTLLESVKVLVEAMKVHSASLGHIIVPLLRECFSPGAISFLDQDGLGLWISALRHSNTIESVNGAPALIDLFPIAIDLLAENLDLLGSILSVIQSYLLLNANLVLQAHATPLLGAFAKAMDAAMEVNVKDMIVTLELMTQLGMPSLWGEALHVSGVFAKMLVATIDDKVSTTRLTEHIYFYSRLALADPGVFMQLMTATAQTTNLAEGRYLYEGLLDQWWGKFDNMSQPHDRKLTAMGIACLVSTGREEVLARLSTEIFNLWLDVFSELKEAVEEDNGVADPIEPSPLTFYWRDSSQPPSEFLGDTVDTLEFDRRTALWKADPVQNVKLTVFVRDRLNQAADRAGGFENLNNIYLRTADENVFRQLQNELASNR